MKRLSFPAAGLACVLLAAACKKDNKNNNELAGTWQLKTGSYQQVYNTKVMEDTFVSYPANFFSITFLPGDSCFTSDANGILSGGHYQTRNEYLYTQPVSFGSIRLDSFNYYITDGSMNLRRDVVTINGSDRYVATYNWVYKKL